MLHSDLQRALVIGNGGSGKTWLATRLAAALSLPLVSLDDLHWQPGTYGVRRDKDETITLVREAAAAERWVIEGVYGWLADLAVPRATALIWLDLPEEDCIAAIRQRGIQGGGSAEGLESLIQWVGEYRVRTNANSFTAHDRIFGAFAGPKLRLMDLAAVTTAAAELATLP